MEIVTAEDLPTVPEPMFAALTADIDSGPLGATDEGAVKAYFDGLVAREPAPAPEPAPTSAPAPAPVPAPVPAPAAPTTVELEYDSVIIAADRVLVEACLALLPRALIILYDPTAPSAIIEAIPYTLFVIVLCDVSDEVIEYSRRMCREVRVVDTGRCPLQVAEGGAACAGPRDHIEGAADVVSFDINDFLDYIPMPTDMFTTYVFDKMLAAAFECCYKPKTYEVTAECGRALIDGIRASGQSVANAVTGMVNEGLRNFAVEAEYTTLGRMLPRIAETRLRDKVQESTPVTVARAAGGTRMLYRLILDPLPADTAAAIPGLVSVCGFDANGIVVAMRTADYEAACISAIATEAASGVVVLTVSYAAFPTVFMPVHSVGADN